MHNLAIELMKLFANTEHGLPTVISPLNHYIPYVSPTKCFSYYGYRAGKRRIYLRDPRCAKKGTILHELLHSLGFYHEQARSDRDNYIKIVYDNIKDKKKYNFDKQKTDNQNFPYDYESVMHYSPKAFTRNGQFTIKTLDPEKQSLLGQRFGLSFQDIQEVKKAYGCSGWYGIYSI